LLATRPEAGNLARKLIDMALAGNERALLAIKDYLWPKQRGRSIELDLGIVCDTRTALSGLTKIIAAMSTGDDGQCPLSGPIQKTYARCEVYAL
jgi:hypothetical protein